MSVAVTPPAGFLPPSDPGATHATVAIAVLGGRILDALTPDPDNADGPERVLDTTLAEGTRLLERGDHDPARLMRSGVWQHPVRNRRLARLAGLVAAGHLGAAREAFPQLTGLRLRRPGGRVVLLAGNLEHALALAGHLPDPPVVCDDGRADCA